MTEGDFPPELPEGLAELLSSNLGRIVGMHRARSDDDFSSVEFAQKVRVPLEQLLEKVASNKQKLVDIQVDLAEMFEDTGFVYDNLANAPGSLSLFPQLAFNFSKGVSDIVSQYLRLATLYEIEIKGKIPFQSDLENMSSSQQRSAVRAGQVARALLQESIQTYFTVMLNLPELVKGIGKSLKRYDDYLQERFIKSDEKPAQEFSLMDLMRGGRAGPQASYVKVQLVDGNPVLTDILLNTIDLIPRYKEVTKTVGQRKKTVKTISRYKVSEVAETLAALSDPTLQNYIQVPEEFFRHFGGIVQDLYQIVESLIPSHKAILDLPFVGVMGSVPDQVERIISEDPGKLKRETKAIKEFHVDTVDQDVDELLPNNSKETKYIAQRDLVFADVQDMYATLMRISNIDRRIATAEKLLLKISPEISELTDLGLTDINRKLRKDKKGDNEFYVGRQQGHGTFCYERKPAPDVQLDDVIGESFARAKQHLRQIIETGKYSRVMELSAPGRKVKSNILLIGPYGCGKTELARGVCADPKVIGATVSVANTLTAYMHESVGNVKRIYDEAVQLRDGADNAKPVILVLDEFDGWFAGGERGTLGDTDMRQIENILLEVLDGMENYNGIVTVAMTNKPKEIPKGIMRRFRYVDIVGQLTDEERISLLDMYLSRSFPLHESVPEHYAEWAKQLVDAPGDVVRKVVDELHFAVVPDFIATHSRVADRLERVLYQREVKHGHLSDKDSLYLRGQMAKSGVQITPDDVSQAITYLLKQPPIQMQIKTAKQVYRDAELVLQEISEGHSHFGLHRRSELFDT